MSKRRKNDRAKIVEAVSLTLDWIKSQGGYDVPIYEHEVHLHKDEVILRRLKDSARKTIQPKKGV